jgi:hypothetical protein
LTCGRCKSVRPEEGDKEERNRPDEVQEEKWGRALRGLHLVWQEGPTTLAASAAVGGPTPAQVQRCNNKGEERHVEVARVTDTSVCRDEISHGLANLLECPPIGEAKLGSEDGSRRRGEASHFDD